MRIGLFLLPLFFLGGCQSAQQFAQETKSAGKEFVEGAKKELDVQVPEPLANAFEEAKRRAPEASAQVQQGMELSKQVLAGHGIHLDDRAWIEKTLKEGGESAAVWVRPMLYEIHKRYPEARAWVEQVTQKGLNEAKGGARTAWQSLKTQIDSQLQEPAPKR